PATTPAAAMSVVAARKCVRHPAREAVARCSSCSDHFCRECVVEHRGVLLCADCLAAEAAGRQTAKRALWSGLGEVMLSVACIVFLWVVFYGFGQFIKLIPAKVHEGTVWRSENS
ncbi:MAG: B-box zinc finger protein, partial [Oleiharenicola lentus]